MIKLYDKPIRVNKSSQDRNSVDVGANLFVGNLDPDVDEKLLYDTFSAFGLVITTPKIMRDPDTGTSRGFGFVSFQNFESSDAAIESMNGQFLCNRPVTVTYAFKKDSRGERHGTPAERLLAQKNAASRNVEQRPHTLFASAPGQVRGQQPGNAPPPPPPFGVGGMPGMPGMPGTPMIPTMLGSHATQAAPMQGNRGHPTMEAGDQGGLYGNTIFGNF